MSPLRTTLLAITLVLPALPAHTEQRPDWRAANLTAVDAHIVPGYRALATTTATLHQRLTALCAQPNADTLAAARSGYHQAMDAWQGIQHIRFGPVQLFLRHHRFQLWPDKHGTGAKQLRAMLTAKDDTKFAPGAFRHTSVAVQGFMPLERLLFGTESAAFGTAEAASYRCRLAAAIGTNLAEMAAGTLQDWSQGKVAFRQAVATAAAGNDYFDTDTEVSARLLNNLHTQLQAIVDQKLGRPLGGEETRPFPRRAESWRSRRSLRNIALNLAATEALYRVTFEARIHDPEAKRALTDAFARARRQADAIDASLYELAGSEAGRQRLRPLVEAVAALRHRVANTLPAAIGIPLGFNSLDGD